MKQFKYSLAKKGKIICTNCGKKTAVPYIETETQNVVNGAMRCDREEKCGYHKKPESNDVVFIPNYVQQIKQTDYIPLAILEKHFLNPNDCNLIEFLKTIFPKEKVIEKRNDYFISTIGKNTVFWQIDQLEKIRSGKIMEYNKETGKRVKDQDGKAHINWIHRQPYNLKQCLFGLHITKDDKNKTIAIVESEKTALIMSIFVPEFLWLATGSKNGFKIEYITPIKYRKIITFPDKGCYKEWFDKALEMNNFGYNITTSDLIETTDCANGLDIADLYLNEKT